MNLRGTSANHCNWENLGDRKHPGEGDDGACGLHFAEKRQLSSLEMAWQVLTQQSTCSPGTTLHLPIRGEVTQHLSPCTPRSEQPLSDGGRLCGPAKDEARGREAGATGPNHTVSPRFVSQRS